jgi:uncharacterized protein (DUF2267 family)
MSSRRKSERINDIYNYPTQSTSSYNKREHNTGNVHEGIDYQRSINDDFDQRGQYRRPHTSRFDSTYEWEEEQPYIDMPFTGNPQRRESYNRQRDDQFMNQRNYEHRNQNYGRRSTGFEREIDERGYQTRRKNRISGLNFIKYAEEGNRFVNEVCTELGINDRNKTSRIIIAVLHAIRDRIPPDDAIEFAQGLPMALKGVFIDQYDISDTPVIIRSKRNFLDFIQSKNQFAYDDFQTPWDVVQGLQAVFRVLENHMDIGQINQLKNQLNIEIRELIEDQL